MPHFTGQDATAFQAKVVAILQYVTTCLRRRLMKKHIIICTDKLATVAAVGADGTKSLLVGDCIEKLTALSEVKRVTIMWVPGRSGIQQNETADRLVREVVGTRPIIPDPFLPLSLSKFKSETINLIGKRKQVEWRVFKRYGTSQLFL